MVSKTHCYKNRQLGHADRAHKDQADGSFCISRKNTIVDLLSTAPSPHSFAQRIRQLGLSDGLTHKALCRSAGTTSDTDNYLYIEDEKELATEVLLYRHAFTRMVFSHGVFRQAALSVIQNIYLFKQRKIFFAEGHLSAEQQRQEALLLLTSSPNSTTIPLAKTFQHMLIARVWQRIVSQSEPQPVPGSEFAKIHTVVEKLNTLRNIYMMFSIGLAHRLTRQISPIYQHSITREDALQIGSFGIARAAYRYHPNMGIRFSTYAAGWVKKEIQRQALEGRLIRLSSYFVEQCAKAARDDTLDSKAPGKKWLGPAVHLDDLSDKNVLASTAETPELLVEQKQLQEKLMTVLPATLTGKHRDLIERRYGLGRYRNRAQTVVEIAQSYGVTRSSIYQLEKSALKQLRAALDPDCTP